MQRYRDLYRRSSAKLKKTEAAYRRLATAIDQVVDSIVITDPDGVIQYVNPAFEKSSGYPKEDAIGMTPGVLKSGEHPQSFYDELWKTINGGRVWHGRLVNKKKNGQYFTEKATISPVKDSNGTIINFVAVKHDISRELELEQQLQQAVKMEALGTLAGGIAHDFNNILAAILGYTRMAMDDISPESRPYHDLLKVVQSGDRAADLVRQIMLFSRQERQDLLPIQLTPLFKETLKMLRASLPSSIILRDTISPDCPPIMADPTQIQQILLNLCSNAKQAMLKSGGTLDISLAELQQTGEEASHKSMPPGSYLHLLVTDSGTGISQESLTRIFDPFFTTKPIGEGTGLGLAVVHGIVKNHMGSIEVRSIVGQGSSFSILFPVSNTAPEIKTDESTAIIPRGCEHILVVDDEVNILSIRKRLLSGLGYKVSIFSSSLKALDAFSKDPSQYDLLLTDMTMPDMDGRELRQRVHDIRPGIPVILCTGHSELINKRKAAQDGFRAFLEKPIKPSTMANILRRILDDKNDTAH